MKYRPIFLTLFVLLFLCLVGVLVGAAPAQASTTITVNTTSDVIGDDGFCSLREAIRVANLDMASGTTSGECPAGNGADTIILPTGFYPLTIAGVSEDAALSGDLDITSTVAISGTGTANVTINGNGLDRVFHIVGTLSVTISDVTISGGNAFGGGVRNDGGRLIMATSVISGNNASIDAGGIYNSGVLTITNSMFISNTAGFSGGGIRNDGTLTLAGSTLSGNNASGGGGVYNFGGFMTITNSTLSGNSSNMAGGIENNAGTVTINNSTISSNQASFDSGGIRNSSGTINIQNTILAGNTGGASPDYSGTLNLQGNNLIGGNPQLGPLLDNGGPTLTHAPLPGSPAIDAGNNATCAATDQRGGARPVDGDGNGSAICDIGAFEFGASIPTAWIYLPLILRGP